MSRRRRREREEPASREEPVAWMLLARGNPFLPVERQRFAVPGSTVVMANCGHWVLLSPQGRRQFQMAYTMCLDCDLASVDPMYTGKMEGERYAVPGGVEAAIAGLPQHQVDQVRAWMKDLDIKEL